MKEIDPVALFRLSVLGHWSVAPSWPVGNCKPRCASWPVRSTTSPARDAGRSPRKPCSNGCIDIAARDLQGWRRSRAAITVNPRSAPPCRSGSWPPSGRTRVARSTCCGSCWRTKAWYRGVRCRVRRSIASCNGRDYPVLSAPTVNPRNGAASWPSRANQIWFGDVMHGPRVLVQGRSRKTYLVSLLDDASRLIVHSAFCLAETALEIEGVLKQGVLKRGIAQKTHRRQWIRLSLSLVARHLRSTLHQSDLLQALRARGKGQVGTLAQNPSDAVLERVAPGSRARAGGP